MFRKKLLKTIQNRKVKEWLIIPVSFSKKFLNINQKRLLKSFNFKIKKNISITYLSTLNNYYPYIFNEKKKTIDIFSIKIK